MSKEFLFLLPLWIIIVGSLLILIMEAIFKEFGRKIAFSFSFLILLIAFLVQIFVYNSTLDYGKDILLFYNTVKITSLTNLFILSSIFAVLLTVLFSEQYLIEHQSITGEYYFLLFMVLAGMINLIVANELLTFFVGLELMSIASYVLTGYYRVKEQSIEAAIKYYLPGVFSTGLILMGIAFIYGITGTTFFDQISFSLTRKIHLQNAFYVGFLFLLSGVAFKLTFVPFHSYAPDVYQGASAPISGLLSTGIKVAVFASFVRIYGEAIPLSADWNDVFITLSILTMFVGNIMALKQDNIKRMLAYSSIAHAGYILVAFVSFKNASLRDIYFSVGFYLFSYTFMTLGAFGLLGWFSRKDEKYTYLHDLSGISKSYPWMSLAMAVFMFSLTGFPPTAGFFAKYYIFRLAIQSGYTWLAIVAILNSFLSAYYYLRVIIYMIMNKEQEIALSNLNNSFKIAVLLCILGIFVLPFIAFP
ncbi:MAG: NADH-quinone oxidoreductase subunit N [Candidatus Omnitrophica bacterium]|nr:NADH-quinone oxidoreductase subunit N [Candidatus Omnitrophota bacterium]